MSNARTDWVQPTWTIHDTVLIAAFFCLCNRYVDGLGTWTPEDPDFYRQRAKIVVANGYVAATLTPGVIAQHAK